jgi:hypothetical protein
LGAAPDELSVRKKIILETRMLNILEQRLNLLGLPVRVVFWNGSASIPGTPPKVRLALRRPSALKLLASRRLA